MLRKCLVAVFLFVSGVWHLPAATIQYSARQDIATGFQHLTGLAVADFNGDGFPDLAVTDDFSNKVVVYLNNGKGGFGSPIITTLTATGYGGLGSLVAGDLNEDGKQDLIVAPVGGLQYDIVLLGNGDGTFTQGQILQSTYGFINGALVDVNGDKHLDLISGSNPAVDVELGDGKGNFQQLAPPGPYGSYFNTGLAVGDFNGDGHVDFLTAAYNSGQVELTLGKGDGSFQVPSAVVSNFPDSLGITLASADFNGDGKLDFLLGAPDVVALYFGKGDGTFLSGLDQPKILPIAATSSTGVQASGPPLVAAADLDGNGTADVVVADDSAQALSVLLNDGSGKFSQAMPDFTAALDLGSGVLKVADLNGDGLPDIIVTNYKTQNISIFLSVFPKATPTLTLQSSAAQALVGSSVMVSVQVKGAGSAIPTGTVTLASGSTSFGQQTLDATGAAAFTLTGLAVGQYSLVPSYSGDKAFTAVAGSAVSQTITDFQLALASATQTVKAGASATYGLGVTPLAAFSGSLALSCTGLPANYACAPSTATLSGQPSTINVVVSPPATSAELERVPSPSNLRGGVLFCGVFGLCLYSRKRRLPMLFMCLLALFGAGALVGCSGGTSGPKLYTGTSSFTITAVATQGTVTVTHQVAATLVVQ